MYLDVRNLRFFLGILLVILANGVNASQVNAFCREGIFKASKEPMYINVTKTFFTNSLLECAHLCRAEKNCEAFKKRNVETTDEVNCQVSEGEPELATMIEDADRKEGWTVYILQLVESTMCVQNNLCNSGGRCLADSCEPGGFRCECDDKHYGKYCQYEYYDYDIVFPNTTADNVIDIGTIDTDFNEFTFSAWIKLNPGSIKYPLLSYITKDSDGSNLVEMVTLMLDADDPSGQTISRFFFQLFGQYVGSSTVAINDGSWHHMGFSWSGISGEWNLLFDGVLWATKTVFKGRTIPSGGHLTIGRVIESTVRYHLVGIISRVNFWSLAKAGSEIEQISKKPGSRDGDLIKWSVLQDLISGDLTIDRPSNAAFSGNGTNYDLILPTLVNISYPGPSKAIEKLSSCLWFKGSGYTPFFAYNTMLMFRFGYGEGNLMVSIINGVATNRTAVGTTSHWHFLCMKWNGIIGTVMYYYDGHIVSNFIQDEGLRTELPAKKDFILGLNDRDGTMTQLNIWNYEVAAISINVMSSGGFNVHGNLLSWINMAKYATGKATTHENSQVFLPGFTVLAKRTKWCNDNYPNSPCPGQFLARLGGHQLLKTMEWRCYCPESLHLAKYTYNFDSNNARYYSRQSELTAIN